ncbi:MAG: DUF4402 domain-containing protein [Novosphingobium sp.]
MTWGKSCRGGGPRQAWRWLCAAVSCGFALAASPTLAGPNDTATTTGAGRAVVVSPLSLIKVRDMDFGRIAARPLPGTVTIDPVLSGCAVTGPIIRIGTCQPAEFVGMGAKNMNARVSLNSIVNLTGPGQAMVLDQVFLGINSTITFAGNPNANGRGVGLTTGNGNAQRYQINSNTGIFSLFIGGRLNVNANQAPGIYRGSITVTVQYN